MRQKGLSLFLIGRDARLLQWELAYLWCERPSYWN